MYFSMRCGCEGAGPDRGRLQRQQGAWSVPCPRGWCPWWCPWFGGKVVTGRRCEEGRAWQSRWKWLECEGRVGASPAQAFSVASGGLESGSAWAPPETYLPAGLIPTPVGAGPLS